MNSDAAFFIPGKRYRNRLGSYEVLAVRSTGIEILYDDGTRETVANAKDLRRIFENMEFEAELRTPYTAADARNARYFYTLGHLAKRGRFEAIVPPHSQAGFEQQYQELKGVRPRPGVAMYYLHKDPDVDKWGTELRITFDASPAELGRLDFGPGVSVVASPVRGTHRINNNAFIWRLWEVGFRLGDVQDPVAIRNSIPREYEPDFARGLQSA